QRVEILKTLYRGADILILDEPTAVLTPQETEELFDVIRRIVKEKDMTVIIITHKLYEVMAISDRVGVMRQGKLVGVENTKDVNERILASMMVGREVLFDTIEKTGTPGEVKLETKDLYVTDNRGLLAVNGINMQVRAGEVLGIAAIEGNGQSELLEAITGLRHIEKGSVLVNGEDIAPLSAGEIRARGLSHVPEDRMTTGVALPSSIIDNLIIGKEKDPEYSIKGIQLKDKAIRGYANELFEKFDMRGAGVDIEVGSLSGGNMQKVVIAREFSYDSNVLIIAQPTRGVDVGAIEFIHKVIIEKRNQGAAILLVSADLDEVFRLSDRIITIYEGEVTGEFKAGEISKMDISYYMTGHRDKEGSEA
ncbi:MAG: ATP-binding cassette domain-containing protein, partial [Clostridia bacterium]|nr:ATP-binding cassette domain-containing protein [Clostridia bacterium]